MRGTIFWDVDTQRDFFLPDGRLYIQGAEAILPNLQALTGFARDKGVPLLGSVNYHSPQDEEISPCGQDKVDATLAKDPLFVDSTPVDKEALKQQVRRHLERGGEVVFRKQHF